MNNAPETADQDKTMAVTVTWIGDTALITVSGEIDIATGAELRHALADALEADAAGSVILDLTAVTFLGSTGIAVLADSHWQATQQSRSLRLVAPADHLVNRALQVTGLHRQFVVCPDVDAALHAG